MLKAGSVKVAAVPMFFTTIEYTPLVLPRAIGSGVWFLETIKSGAITATLACEELLPATLSIQAAGTATVAVFDIGFGAFSATVPVTAKTT